MRKLFYSFLAGLAGFLVLLAFYFITMRLLTGSWDAAISQLKNLWYFMVPLSIGFGVQMGLYWYLRILAEDKSSRGVLMANTTTSTVGMIACCAHHLTDVLPILGLSALSLFLVKFQAPILIIGIISNTLSIYYLVSIIKQVNGNTKKQR